MSYFTNAISYFLFYYNLLTLSSRNWKGLAAKQAEKKEKKNRGARCRYRFTVPQILASIFKLHHTSFRINKIVAHPLFVFQVSRPDSSSPGQGIIAVIRDVYDSRGGLLLPSRGWFHAHVLCGSLY